MMYCMAKGYIVIQMDISLSTHLMCTGKLRHIKWYIWCAHCSTMKELHGVWALIRGLYSEVYIGDLLVSVLMWQTVHWLRDHRLKKRQWPCQWPSPLAGFGRLWPYSMLVSVLSRDTPTRKRIKMEILDICRQIPTGVVSRAGAASEPDSQVVAGNSGVARLVGARQSPASVSCTYT